MTILKMELDQIFKGIRTCGYPWQQGVRLDEQGDLFQSRFFMYIIDDS